MTIQEAKNKLTAWCKDQVGYAEGYNNYNKYATGRYSAYGWDVQNQPWCDVFVDCAFIETFGLDAASRLTYQPRGGFSAKCSISADYYKNNGAYFYSPEVGDQVFFNVDGGINHTGIVVKVGGGLVETVEGNSSDSVRNTLSVSNEPDTEPDRLADAVLTRFQVARFDAEAAVNFAPEVEENMPAAGHNARGVFVAHNGRGGLAENRLQEFFRVLNPFFRDGDNALGVQILTDALVLNGVRREIVGESFRQRDRFFRFDRLGVCVRRG